MTITLAVAPRSSETMSNEALRKAGKIPAVVYGPKQPAQSLIIDKKVFDKVLAEAGEATIISLTGAGSAMDVLIHDVSFDPNRGGIIHADFYAIDAAKELTTDVPLEFINHSPLEKSGATVVKALHEIEVTCKPNALPSHIDVDLSVLVSDESNIHVKDLQVPKGVTIETDPEIIVASIVLAREETEDEMAAAPDMSAIEVEKKGKEESAE